MSPGFPGFFGVRVVFLWPSRFFIGLERFAMGKPGLWRFGAGSLLDLPGLGEDFDASKLPL